MMTSSQIKKVKFFFHEVRFTLSGRTLLKSFILNIFQLESTSVDAIHVIFCSDNYLLAINQKYLQHDFYTDIITFNLSSVTTSVQGEVYISIERVKENARSLQIAFNDELLRVIFHGVLHLCGYQDKTPLDIIIMRKKELDYINSFKNV